MPKNCFSAGDRELPVLSISACLLEGVGLFEVLSGFIMTFCPSPDLVPCKLLQRGGLHRKLHLLP